MTIIITKNNSTNNRTVHGIIFEILKVCTIKMTKNENDNRRSDVECPRTQDCEWSSNIGQICWRERG